ncbi:oligosaccharide flippase family protein [Hujiaoplasma nucleasis]|uniref:Oligosaccharide flippase family protein n=1 Tax=Hujiaoplasma nucleasis TaxID=2725268 RepID=A0A7L6N3M3_9MOLU|nr:oligosaccharide flippase family protein [Hujiaoplasma nucleasis]QLY39818.1 oligosaccharide flippase family protein [Hujiaoplasma nucleasis]
MSNRAIGKDTAKLSFSEIFTLTISMISAMLLSRFRTLEEYGTYSQILLITNLAMTLLMLGLPNSINYFLSRATNQFERDKFLSTYFVFSTILGLLIGLILILSTNLIVEYFNNPMLKTFWFVLAFYPWSKLIISSVSKILIVYNSSNKLIIYKISNGIGLIFIIIIVQLLNLEFFYYMILFVFVELLFTFIVYLIVSKKIQKFHFSMEFAYLKMIFAYSVPIGLASLVGTINKQMDKLIVGRYFSVKEMAIFTNAAKELPVTFIALAFTSVGLPVIISFIHKNEVEKAILLWKKIIIISFLFLAYFTVGIFVFAPDVITLLYSDKYIDGVLVFRLYSLLLLMRFTYFGMILNALGKTKFILYSSIFTLVVNLILNIAFYRLFGFIGPAIATLVSVFLMQLVQLIVTSKLTKINFSSLFPWKDMFIILVITIIIGILMLQIKMLLPIEIYIGSILESILLACIGGVALIFIYYKKVYKLWKDLNNYY